MSISIPHNTGDLRHAGWIFLTLFFFPMPVLLFFWWHLYFNLEALLGAWVLAIVVGSVLTWLIYQRHARLVKLGLHPKLAKNERMPAKTWFFALTGIVVSSWCWVLFLLALLTLPSAEVDVRDFKIGEARECTLKCGGCQSQVSFSNWVDIGAAPRFCADGMKPLPRIGDQVTVRGRFGNLVVYVHDLSRGGE